MVGSDRRTRCAGQGDEVGLNDLIVCVGRRFGALPADIYPPLEGRIPELSAVVTHLNNTGYVLVAQLIRRVLRRERPHRAERVHSA